MNAGVELRFVATTRFEGGAEKYIAELASLLDASGRPVRLLGDLRTWPASIPHGSIRSGPKWSLKTLPLGILRIVAEMRSLKREIASLSPGVYNLHFKREQIAFSRLLRTRGRVVWTEHGRFPTGPFGLLIRPFYRRASRSADSIVCVSEIVAKDIARFVSDPSIISVIDTAVDLTRFAVPSDQARRDLRQKFGLDDRPTVVYVGRIEAKKRPDIAIQAGLDVGAQVLVAGVGSYYAQLVREFGSYSDVKFLGYVQDTREVYAVADVHIFSSTGAGEGFPTVIIESAATGLPTVGTSDAGFGYAIDPAGGQSCLPTSQAIAQAIENVLLSLPERRRAARVWAESRDQATWMMQYSRIFFGPQAPPGGNLRTNRGLRG
jgi:glycosyltransferase involved in cell wall biosynthesis